MLANTTAEPGPAERRYSLRLLWTGQLHQWWSQRSQKETYFKFSMTLVNPATACVWVNEVAANAPSKHAVHRQKILNIPLKLQKQLHNLHLRKNWDHRHSTTWKLLLKVQHNLTWTKKKQCLTFTFQNLAGRDLCPWRLEVALNLLEGVTKLTVATSCQVDTNWRFCWEHGKINNSRTRLYTCKTWC